MKTIKAYILTEPEHITCKNKRLLVRFPVKPYEKNNSQQKPLWVTAFLDADDKNNPILQLHRNLVCELDGYMSKSRKNTFVLSSARILERDEIGSNTKRVLKPKTKILKGAKSLDNDPRIFVYTVALGKRSPRSRTTHYLEKTFDSLSQAMAAYETFKDDYASEIKQFLESEKDTGIFIILKAFEIAIADGIYDIEESDNISFEYIRTMPK